MQDIRMDNPTSQIAEFPFVFLFSIEFSRQSGTQFKKTIRQFLEKELNLMAGINLASIQQLNLQLKINCWRQQLIWNLRMTADWLARIDWARQHNVLMNVKKFDSSSRIHSISCSIHSIN